jgi:hypothetical protein
MTDLNTTNARVPHHTLVQVRELKELLGLKSLSQTWEHLVRQALNAEHIVQLRDSKRYAAELLDKALGK